MNHHNKHKKTLRYFITLREHPKRIMYDIIIKYKEDKVIKMRIIFKAKKLTEGKNDRQ